MAVIVTIYPDQDATGYVSVAAFKAWADQRLSTYTNKSDDQIGAAINIASEYMDTRFSFVGYRKDKDQAREWPRSDAWDVRGDLVEEVPQAIKDACCGYALRALNGVVLMPDPDRDDSGRELKSKSEKVGPIAVDVEYETGSAYALPSFPSTDRILHRHGLVCKGPSGIAVGVVSRG